MKLPQARERADPALSFKFIENPVQVASVDELYELFDLHKNEPHKFVCMLRDTKLAANLFPLQLKLFRKFFYENSSPADDLVTFVEVSNARLGEKLGLTSGD